jgi:hypothetical protein
VREFDRRERRGNESVNLFVAKTNAELHHSDVLSGFRDLLFRHIANLGVKNKLVHPGVYVVNEPASIFSQVL